MAKDFIQVTWNQGYIVVTSFSSEKSKQIFRGGLVTNPAHILIVFVFPILLMVNE